MFLQRQLKRPVSRKLALRWAEDLAQKDGHLVIAEETKAGESPSGKISEADQGSHLFQFFG
jgi:hypothetical protein